MNSAATCYADPRVTPSSASAARLRAAAARLAAELATTVLGLALSPPPPPPPPPPLPPLPLLLPPRQAPAQSGLAAVHHAVAEIVRHLEVLVAASLRLGIRVAGSPGGLAILLPAPEEPILEPGPDPPRASAPPPHPPAGQAAPPGDPHPAQPMKPAVVAVEWLVSKPGSGGGGDGGPGDGSGDGTQQEPPRHCEAAGGTGVGSGGGATAVVLWVVSPGLVRRVVPSWAGGQREGGGAAAAGADEVVLPVRVVGWRGG